MRLIDADALEREGWSFHRNYQQDKNTMVYETKSIVEIPTAQPERMLCLHGDESVIEILSELRNWFSCFDEKEGLAYHALSFAIKAVKAQADMRGGAGWLD